MKRVATVSTHFTAEMNRLFVIFIVCSVFTANSRITLKRRVPTPDGTFDYFYNDYETEPWLKYRLVETRNKKDVQLADRIKQIKFAEMVKKSPTLRMFFRPKYHL